ncbi:MAG: hypothetical protein ACRD7E_26190 [Bryobacteraceae bacterium]
MKDSAAAQHVNAKIFASYFDIDLADAIPVFHGWIQNGVQNDPAGEILVDVADYRHVPAGPGVMLIGHHAFYSLDSRDNRFGLLYSRRTALEESFQDRLRQAYTAALSAARRLEQEAAFLGRLRFDAGTWEFWINDRALAPNTEETWETLRKEFHVFLDEVFGEGAYVLNRAGSPRELLRFDVTTS